MGFVLSILGCGLKLALALHDGSGQTGTTNTTKPQATIESQVIRSPFPQNYEFLFELFTIFP